MDTSAAPAPTPVNLTALSDDALIQLLADASAELNWRRKTRKPVGWVEPPRPALSPDA